MQIGLVGDHDHVPGTTHDRLNFGMVLVADNDDFIAGLV
jgi:hypothetical protein